MTTTTPDKIRTYQTELTACRCPDRYYRRHECKHMKALRDAVEIVRASSIHTPNAPTPSAYEVDQ